MPAVANIGGVVIAQPRGTAFVEAVSQTNGVYEVDTVLASGSVELIVDDVKSIVHAPACLTIQANKHHGVKSLTEVVWYCIHATECIEIDEIDDVLIVAGDDAEMHTLAESLKE